MKIKNKIDKVQRNLLQQVLNLVFLIHFLIKVKKDFHSKK